MAKLLIKSGRVIDPANKVDALLDILIEDDKIARVAGDIRQEADKIIDASGKIIMPGLLDMHVHLREPGREDKETICSATKAALHGGITTVLAMPNTDPAIDSLESIRFLKEAIKRSAKAQVLICAAITRCRKGEELTDIGLLQKEGALAISDDGASVDSDELMLKALKSAKKAGVLTICHCEDKKLSNLGVVNRGFTATRLGLRGISRESEYERVSRDISLAQKSDARVHIAHISCSESVEIVAKAKKKGVKVTCETAPHYFVFSEEELLGYDANFKMNPPLRTGDDVEAIRQGLRQGVIDAIASDHAPHTENEKEIEFERAEFGVIGLETELAAAITWLVKPGLISWDELVRVMSLNPSRILGIDRGSLGAGKAADLIVVDPDAQWEVKKENFFSKSRNSSFLGRRLSGIVECTVFKGKANKWNS
jgi:dihydroorotase